MFGLQGFNLSNFSLEATIFMLVDDLEELMLELCLFIFLV